MKVTVALEVENRVVVEQATVMDARQAWRDVMSDIACRIELGTFGPPMDEELSKTDAPYHFIPNRPNT